MMPAEQSPHFSAIQGSAMPAQFRNPGQREWDIPLGPVGIGAMAIVGGAAFTHLQVAWRISAMRSQLDQY